MAIDRRDRPACEQTLAETDFHGLGERIVGKVRDSYLGTPARFAPSRASRAGRPVVGARSS
ncbi:MAG: hypothetical protein R3E53_11980 [Myxococcota bacterium]